MKNIEEINTISTNTNSINGDSSMNNLLNKIFIFSKETWRTIPLLKKNCGEELRNIFDISKGKIKKDSLASIIVNKINILKEIKKLISNKFEIIHIINNYLSKYDIYLFKNYIDLYLQYLLSGKKDMLSKDILKNFEEIFIWFINCGLLDKNIIDYVFQKIAKLQLEQTLTIDTFNIYLPLIEILYGKNTLNLKYDLIAKNYIYLFDRNTSIIKTNVSPLKTIKITNGFCILIWFYLYEYCYENQKSKGTICQIITKDFQKIDFIINNNYDIDLKYNTSELLKEQKGNKFKLKNNIWIQLKIQFIENEIKLFLYQNYNNNLENKYEIKSYLINKENKINENSNKNIIINKLNKFNCNNFIITYLNFFMGYEGLVGTILFYNDGNNGKNNDNIIFNYKSGLQNSKVNDFINNINLKNFYFIISPILYCKEDNKFIDSLNNINSELSLETKENNLNLNSVIKINNYTKNIFHLGGCNNILPLFEILYNFSIKIDNNSDIKSNEYELKISNILKNLFQLLELIFVKKMNNCIDAYKISYHFFESLQLFLENIDEKYYNIYNKSNKVIKENEKENCLVSSLLNLGKYFFEMKNKKILEPSEKNGFFANILFYPSIIMKFNLIQQNIIFSFFDIIKKDGAIFKNSDYKTYFISFDKISKLLILISEKNNDIYIPSKLFNIIKIMFEDFNTTDNERESLFLLYNNHLISDKVFINIMEIFIIYFDINTNIKRINNLLSSENIKNNSKTIEGEKIINMRNNSIKYFLSSSNYFIEKLLYILLSKNLIIKKLIINFLRILTNKYNDIFEEYFSFVDECNRNYKNKRITKKEFFFFIKENIIINEYNEKIIRESEKNKDKNITFKTNKKRTSSIDNIINRNKLDEVDDGSKIIKKRKSAEIQFNKNQKKKIVLNITKKKKKRKSEINNINIRDNNNTKKRIFFSKEKNYKKNDSNIYYNIIKQEKEKQNVFNKHSSKSFSKKKKKRFLLNDDDDKKDEINIINYKDNENNLQNNIEIENDNKKRNNSIKEIDSKIESEKEKSEKNLSLLKSNNIKTDLNLKKKKYKNRIHISKKQLITFNYNIINEFKEDDKMIANIEDVNINCDISMILYDWFVSINSDIAINDFNRAGTLELIYYILNYIVKFLSNSTELEVIYRTLFIILGQKSLDYNVKDTYEYNLHYSRLLSYFSKSQVFMQLLGEIIIDSFLGYNNDKAIMNQYDFNQNSSKIKVKTSKKDLFKNIYNISKELLIDIYFYKNNFSKNYILYELYNIILKKYGGLQKKYNESIYKLFTLLKNIFIDLINKYHEILNNNKYINNDYNENDILNIENSNEINEINNIENKNESKNKLIYQNLASFLTLFFEFSFAFKNYNKYITKKGYKPEINISPTFPIFLKEGMIFKLNSDINKIENLIIYDEYILLMKIINEIFNLKHIFKDLKLSTNEIDKKEEVFQLDIEIIQTLVNEIVFKKELRGNYKKYIELLFLYHNQSGYFNNFPLINMLSLYKCVFLNYGDNEENNNLIQLLNEIQNYVLFIILISCNIRKDDLFSNKNLNYDDIQEIIYQNLLFIIRNIIYKYAKNVENKNINENDKDEINTNINIINDENENSSSSSIDEKEEEYDSHFIIVLNNILSLMSNIFIKERDLQNTSNSFMRWRISKTITDINSTGVSKLIMHYIKIFNTFFNNDNLHFFSNHNNDESNYLIIQQKNNLYMKLVKDINNIKYPDKSNTELFHYKIFKSICIGRETEIKKKLKLLIKSNQDKNKVKKAINNRYKNLLLKINNLKLYNANNKLIDESRNEIFKIKYYRRIKKNLYSFNNSYSNLDVFYNKNKKNILTYKISNYLSKDKTRKLIVPVLDLDYYIPNFRKYNFIEGKMFKKNILDNIYKINLKIIDKKRQIITPENNNKNYYLFNNICFIKTTHHIRGKLFFKTEKEFSKKLEHFYFYFTSDKNITKEYLLENCPDYDSINGTCFGSLFRNNVNKKDDEVYLKIKFSEINFIFLRKYCFRNNSIEIFLNNNKSYYFKFRTPNDRNNFLEKLIYILNHFLTNNKKIFRKIKSIDENNKTIILGYYKDIDNNRDYKNINSIKELWKNNKISSLEYIMWINIYGNRSFRDTAQYPVFPWILNDYTLNNVENITNLNAIRNFNLPMGMMAFDEKSNMRKEGYIEGYKLMVNEISEDYNIKKPTDSIEDINDEDETKNTTLAKTSSDELLKDSDEDNSINNKNKNENKLKIPNFKYDLDKLYYNTNIGYERLPYIFGTHYSNSMYVSHFLARLFPYSFNMIEIQGDGFDCAERLFFNLKSTFYSSTHEKCDLRELIPEFFTLPEIFMNLNNLNFGETEDRYYINNMNNLQNDNIEEEKEDEKVDNDNNNIINTNSNNSSNNIKTLQINDVVLPPWTKQNPYYFIQIMREIFEGSIGFKNKKKYININPWLDLIFGYYQRGIEAQNKGNLFLPVAYDGVIDNRIKEEDILKNRADNEYLIRFFEFGVNPIKVFYKKCKDIKKEINYQIISFKDNKKTFTLNKKDSIILKNKSPVQFLEINYLDNNKIFILDNSFADFYIYIQKNNEAINNDNIENNYYSVNYLIKDFPLREFKRKNNGYKLIIKYIFKESLLILTGYYDGSIYLINTNKKINKRSGYNISSELNSKENNILNSFASKLITSLEITKDEKYMICGNEKGTLIIFSLNYSLFLENKKYIELLKVIKSHNNNRINSISINNNLFLFADCSYDGYINIYTYPKINLIKSIYLNDNKIKKDEIDYVFLSSQPLPVIVVYSNKNCLFKTYSINGKELNYDYNDLSLLEEIVLPLYNNDSMISPIIITDYKFNEYLCYIFKYKYILIRKFPEMKCYLKINCPNSNYTLTKVVISNDLKNLYIYEENENCIYILDNSSFNKN